MDENLHNDPLENLFRKKLSDDQLDDRQAAPDQWDLPSNQLWDKIETNVNPVSPPAKGIWLSSQMQAIAIAASLLLVLGVFVCFQSYQGQLQQLSQQVEALSKQQNEAETTTFPIDETDNEQLPEEGKEIQDRVNTSNKNLSPNSETEETIKGPASESIKKTNTNTPAPQANSSIKPPTIAATTARTKTEKTPTQSRTPIPELPNSPTPEFTNSLTPEFPNSPTPQLTPPPKRITWTALPTLNKKNLQPIAQNPPQIAQNAKHPKIIKPLKPQVNTGFYAGLFYAPSITALNVAAPRGPINPINFDWDKKQFSFTKGLKMGYQINQNWAIEVEGRHSTSKISTRHPIRLDYSKQKERAVGGDRFEGEYAYSLSTALGDVDTDISISREAATDIPDQSQVLLVLNSEQYFESISIPVAVKYSLGKGPLRLTARTGVATNFILNEKNTIVAASINRLGLKHERTKVIAKGKALKNMNLDYLLSIGLDYQIANHWRISLEPTFNKALTPIFENSRLKTLPRKTSVAVGLAYQF